MIKKWHCAVDSIITLSKEERHKLEGTFTVEYIAIHKASSKQLASFEVCLIHTKIADDVLDRFVNCKYIGARVHNIDYVNKYYVQNNGIVVRGIPQVGEQAVAEQTIRMKQLQR